MTAVPQLIGLLFLLTFLLGMGYGWIMNILNLIHGVYEPIATIVIAGIGVFVPFVGALVHFIAG